jgi:hypothetical protein
MAETVSQATPTLTVVASTASTVTVGTVPTFTATLTGPVTPTAPTGKIIFTINNGSVSCTQSSTVTSGAVSCTPATYPFDASATAYTIVATYNGDTNFTTASGQTSETVIQATAAIAPTSTSTYVNATATLGVTVAPPAPVSGGTAPTGAGVVSPSGTVTFTMSGTTLCTTGQIAANGSASCTYVFSGAATDTITASYSGDANFNAGTSTFSEAVAQGTTTVTVGTTTPTAVASESVIFTATVTQTPVLSSAVTAPTGTVTFNVSGGFSCSTTTPLTPTGSGATSTATCSVVIPSSYTSGSFTVQASYGGDSNFTYSSSAAFGETVQNFTVAFSPTPTPTSPIYLTQGFTNGTTNGAVTANEPLTPVAINMVVTPIKAFNNGLTTQCQVVNVSTGATVADPSCEVGTPASGSAIYPVTVSATSSAPIGAYTVTVSAKYLTLAQSTQVPLYVYVVGVTPALSTPLTLTNGGVAAVGSNIVFNTAPVPSNGTAPTALGLFKCSAIANITDPSAVVAVPKDEALCSGSGTETAGNQQITVQTITIIAVGPEKSQIQQSGNIYAAAFLGIPILVLVGWFGRKNTPRGNFFRFIGLILLLVGVSYATGCGGGYTLTRQHGGGGLPTGNYLIQVVASDTSNTSDTTPYYAVVPLNVQ